MAFKVTEQSKKLFDALVEAGLFVELEYWDGHKHVDIHIPSAKLYVEVDGMHHFTNPDQIARDFQRDHYSDNDGYRTLRLPNAVVEENLKKVVNAILKIVNERVEQ